MVQNDSSQINFFFLHCSLVVQVWYHTITIVLNFKWDSFRFQTWNLTLNKNKRCPSRQHKQPQKYSGDGYPLYLYKKKIHPNAISSCGRPFSRNRLTTYINIIQCITSLICCKHRKKERKKEMKQKYNSLLETLCQLSGLQFPPLLS